MSSKDVDCDPADVVEVDISFPKNLKDLLDSSDEDEVEVDCCRLWPVSCFWLYTIYNCSKPLLTSSIVSSWSTFKFSVIVIIKKFVPNNGHFKI